MSTHQQEKFACDITNNLIPHANAAKYNRRYKITMQEACKEEKLRPKDQTQ